jgi:hypothetical protein
VFHFVTWYIRFKIFGFCLFLECAFAKYTVKYLKYNYYILNYVQYTCTARIQIFWGMTVASLAGYFIYEYILSLFFTFKKSIKFHFFNLHSYQCCGSELLWILDRIRSVFRLLKSRSALILWQLFSTHDKIIAEKCREKLTYKHNKMLCSIFIYCTVQ